MKRTPLLVNPEALNPNFADMKTYYITLVISLALIVGGFLCPPTGVIDGSVLSAVGLLLMFTVVEKIPEAIKAGKTLKVTKGDFSAEVGAESTEMN